MNKTININLGGRPFIIDDNAYEILSNYLEDIHNHFAYSEGCDEIMEDIEIRISELLTERMKEGIKIISHRDISHIIHVMGRPEDIGGSDNHDYDTVLKDEYTSSASEGYQPGKKLFRDPDNKVIGGVCSGISAYLGIEDPIWVRLGMVLLTVFAGLPIMVYIVLMIVVPKAKTSSDRLSMRGKKIDINSIARDIEDEVTSITESLSELNESYKRKKTGRGNKNTYTF